MSMSIPAHFTKLFLRNYIRPFVLHGHGNPITMRKGMAYAMGLIPKPFNVTINTFYLDSLAVVETRPRTPRNDAAMFYVHGGGFVTGSPYTHQAFISRFANATKCIIWSPDYRLAPEHPFPSGLEDTVNAWKTFAYIFKDRRLYLGGESAGGGLSMALCLLAKASGFKLPDLIYLQSPWLDISLSGESHRNFSQSDVLVNLEVAEAAFAHAYAGHYSRHYPLISPIFGDMHGLPPIYVQVSDAELFYSDSITLKQKLLAAGVDITMEIGHGLWHAWPLFAPIVPEASVSIEKAARWLTLEALAKPLSNVQHTRHTSTLNTHSAAMLCNGE